MKAKLPFWTTNEKHAQLFLVYFCLVSFNTHADVILPNQEVCKKLNENDAYTVAQNAACAKNRCVRDWITARAPRQNKNL